MKWAPRYVITKYFSFVGNEIAIFRWFNTCKRHIEKHMLKKKEPWNLVFQRAKYLSRNVKRHQVEQWENLIKEIYGELSPELEKSILTIFTYNLYGYLEKHEDGPRIYGVDPRGFVIILSKASLLTSYYPSQMHDRPYSKFLLFRGTRDCLETTIRKNRKTRSKKDITLIELDQPFFVDDKKFDKFLHKYNRLSLQGTSEEKIRQIKNLGNNHE